jgi:hypothetical protein
MRAQRLLQVARDLEISLPRRLTHLFKQKSLRNYGTNHEIHLNNALR